MYRILLVFLALLLWGCPKHTPTISDLPLTADIEKQLYRLISCARFDLEDRAEFVEDGYYYTENACPVDENPFGEVALFLYPKNEQFDLKVVQAAMYRGDEQEWVDTVFDPIKDMSAEQIAQNFNVLLVVVNKKYLKENNTLESGYDYKYPTKYITYSLKDGKWTKGQIGEKISYDPESWIEYVKNIANIAEGLISPHKDWVHVTNVAAFVRRIESAGDYRKDQEKAADLNGDGYKDHIFVFSPTDSRMPQQPIIVLLSQEKDQYKVFVNEGLHLKSSLYGGNSYDIVVKGKYFTTEGQGGYSDGDTQKQVKSYVTFYAQPDAILLHRIGIITLVNGEKQEIQLDTADFGEVSINDFFYTLPFDMLSEKE